MGTLASKAARLTKAGARVFGSIEALINCCAREYRFDKRVLRVARGDRVPTGLRGGDQPVRTRPGLVPRALL